MARRPGPSSGLSGGSASIPRQGGDARNVDVRGWLGGIRLSGFMAIMLSLVVLGAFVLVPTLGTYLDQRARVAALAESVELGEAEVARLETERDRWKDPAYITTQARERLFYVSPGEVVYLVDNDLDDAEIPIEQKAVSVDVRAAKSDWLNRALRSVTEAGLAQTVAPRASTDQQDAPTDTEQTDAGTVPTDTEQTGTEVPAP